MATRNSIVPEEVIPLEKEELPNIKSLDFRFQQAGLPKLVSADGEELPLPNSVYETIKRAVHLMAQGRPISIVPFEFELTTQEAADQLNVSRPFLVKLLEQNEIPFYLVGSHRRVRFVDLMDYKKKRDKKRKSSLQEITRLSEELGLYDREED
jgi:excisionase family DNA binding protein